MKILATNEVWDWYRSRGIEIYILDGMHTDKPVIPAYQYNTQIEFKTNGIMKDPKAVVKFLASVPEWTECLLVVTSTGVWPSSENWPRFYKWRERNGSIFSVLEMPGHLFFKKDLPELKELASQVFEFGWEGYLLFCKKEKIVDSIIFVSHGGYLEINSNIPLDLSRDDIANSGAD